MDCICSQLTFDFNQFFLIFHCCIAVDIIFKISYLSYEYKILNTKYNLYTRNCLDMQCIFEYTKTKCHVRNRLCSLTISKHAQMMTKLLPKLFHSGITCPWLIIRKATRIDTPSPFSPPSDHLAP